MALHDAYLRRTPFELLFPDPDAVGDFVSAVTAEAREADVDPAHRQAFLTLPSVGEQLHRLQPERPRPESMVDYAMLLYHAFRCAEAAAPTLLMSVGTARRLVGEEGAVTSLELPSPAGYAQLPRNLFWTQASPGAAPEPVDGFFWSVDAEGLLHVLLAAGLRDDRPGMAAVVVPEAPWADAGEWLDVSVREDGRDFATTLPGGEMEELYSLVAAGEVFKLVARLFALMQTSPGSLSPVTAPAPADADPTPSTLPYRRI